MNCTSTYATTIKPKAWCYLDNVPTPGMSYVIINRQISDLRRIKNIDTIDKS